MSTDGGRAGGDHYFHDRPAVESEPSTVELSVGDVAATLVTDRGVFSGDRIDPGTKVLLVDGPPLREHSTRLLDLGCGYGPIAYALATRRPDASVWAIDVNERALSLARQNLDMANVSVGRPDAVPAEATFDEIWSNPPIRIGKAALHELLDTWLRRLEPEGRAVLVVHRHLGADSLARRLRDEGWNVDRFRSRVGYRILTVQR